MNVLEEENGALKAHLSKVVAQLREVTCEWEEAKDELSVSLWALLQVHGVLSSTC